MDETAPKTLNEIYRMCSDELLVALVMQLTGGSANPAVVRAQLKRIRETKPEAT